MLKNGPAHYWQHRRPNAGHKLSIAPQQADLFLIPLLDGAFCVGQIVDVVSDDTALCTISKRKFDGAADITSLALLDLQSLLLITSDAIKSGVWQIKGFQQLPHINSIFNWRDAKRDGYSKLVCQDSAVVEAFANAAFGLYPWDGFGADFFAKFMIYPDQLPTDAVLTSGAKTTLS